MPDQDFYFQPIPRGFYDLVESYFGVTFKFDLIQIALPRLYRHYPLKCVPLYHELGHFIDTLYGVVERAILLRPPAANPQICGSIPPNFGVGLDAATAARAKERILTSHLREFFSDLFAASYAGLAYRDFMNDVFPDLPFSPSHPGTAHRLQAIENFLMGKADPIVELIDEALTANSLPSMRKRYSVPSLAESIQDCRPHIVSSEPEAHGLLEAASQLLGTLSSCIDEPWARLEAQETTRIVNDLVEKSIRNWMIRESWADGAPDKT